MSGEFPGFTPEEGAKLSQIWDQLYELYLARANGERDGPDIDAEIDELIHQRNAIRAWGWSTGKGWKDDLPDEVRAKLMNE